MEEVRQACARVLGFDPDVQLAPMEALPIEAELETFIIPAAFDFSLCQRESLGRSVAEARRQHPDAVIHHDDVDRGHPLVVGALADRVGRACLGRFDRCGLVLAPSGDGDAASRAQSYRLARLLWEELGLARAEVGFVRHARPFLASAFERCASEPLTWLVLPQSQWETEHVEYARVILGNFQRSSPESEAWVFVDPPSSHPMLTAWYAQRITRLWHARRSRDVVRTSSPKHTPTAPATWKQGCGMIARTPDRESLAPVLEQILPASTPGRILVKVTWHGYANGTYTDPAALDLLLSALPAPAIILEGHTTSRNLGGAQFDWETEPKENRAWIRQQEAEYLRRTGLADVMARLLPLHRTHDILTQFPLARAGAQASAEIVLHLRKQAGANLAVGGEPHPAARSAEGLAHRRDDADLAHAILKCIAPRGLARFAERQLYERKHMTEMR